MRNCHYITLILSILFLFCSCTLNPGDSEGDDPAGEGSLSFYLEKIANSPFADLADSAVCIVTASDMDTISKALTITDSSVEGTIAKVPAGNDRLVTLLVYDQDGILQYHGSGLVTIIADQDNPATILLYRATGNLLITGIVVEDTADTALLDSLLYCAYTFNGNADDVSGHGFNGTVYGATACEDRFGEAASAFEFDGVDDYIYVGEINFSQPVSVSLWLKSDSATEIWNTLFGWNNPDTDPEFEGIQIASSGSGDLIIRAGTRWQDQSLGQVVIGDGQWYHVVVSKDVDNNVDIFLNGELVKTVNITQSIGNGHPLYLGKSFQPAFKQEFYRGVMDDVAVYKKALSETEVLNLYRAGGYGL